MIFDDAILEAQTRNFWLLFISFVVFLFGSSTLFADSSKQDSFDRLFKLAISQTSELAATGPTTFYRWNLSSVKIGLYIEGDQNQNVWRQKVEAVENDRRILENNTGKTIYVGGWLDTDPSPNIFVLIADRYQILQRADHLGQLVDRPAFGNNLRQQFADGEALCNSIVALGKPGSIGGALITVDIDRDPDYCFRRQLLVAFGLFGNLPDNSDSILSENQGTLHYSDVDKAILKRLYTLDLPETR